MLSFAIFGFGVFLTGVGCYVAFLLGKNNVEKDIAEANIQALKSAKETGDEIAKLSDTDLRARADKFVRTEDNR